MAQSLAWRSGATNHDASHVALYEPVPSGPGAPPVRAMDRGPLVLADLARMSYHDRDTERPRESLLRACRRE